MPAYIRLQHTTWAMHRDPPRLPFIFISVLGEGHARDDGHVGEAPLTPVTSGAPRIGPRGGAPA
eukprot:1662559-Pyramimonas_sp.AAC.1